MKKLTPEKLAVILGIGLVLFPINFNYEPMQWLGLIPSNLGFLLIIFVVTMLVINKTLKREHFGKPIIYVPLLIIVGSLFARIVVEPSSTSLAGTLMGCVLFSVYLATRALGISVLKPFLWATVVVSISQIIASILSHGDLAITGGVISNYCASAGFVILGFMLTQSKWKQYLICLVAIGLFFTGAAEAIFAVAVLGLIVLIRRDWNKVMLTVLGIVILVIAGWFYLGDGKQLYSHAFNNLNAAQSVVTGDTSDYGSTAEAVDVAVTDRFAVIAKAMKDIKIFGHGLNLTANNLDTVHNVPLVIVDQIGILAAAAWLFVALYCLIKTKWKYVWLTVLVLSVFDHYIFTQFAPMYWCIVGISTSVVIKNDYIFRGNNERLPAKPIL